MPIRQLHYSDILKNMRIVLRRLDNKIPAVCYIGWVFAAIEGFEIKIFNFRARPRSLSQKFQARVDARVFDEAFDLDPRPQLLPAVMIHQVFQYGLNRFSVQKVVRLALVHRRLKALEKLRNEAVYAAHVVLVRVAETVDESRLLPIGSDDKQRERGAHGDGDKPISRGECVCDRQERK